MGLEFELKALCLKALILEPHIQPIALVILEMESLKLFAWPDLEP
jgi:hypothetical protein